MRYTAIDTETTGLHPYQHRLHLMSINDGRTVKATTDLQPYKKILEDPTICKVVHNAHFDLPFIALQANIRVKNVWDTKLCEQIILGMTLPRANRDEEMKKQYSSSLKYTLTRYGFPDLDKGLQMSFVTHPYGKPFSKEQLEYAKNDVRYLLELQQAQEYILTRDGLIELALLENRVVEKVSTMRTLGIGFDVARWLAIADENTRTREKLMAKLPSGINWNSPAQVKAFFRDRGVLINSFDELEQTFKESKNNLLGAFIQARGLYKSVTSYGKTWIEGTVDSDGRVRCDFEQILNTGRFSSSNPNLQQLPADGHHRSAFIPRKGHVFVIGDFSGQEIGIMAAASQEDIWIDALLRGDDIHSLVASMLYEEAWTAGRERKCTFPAKCKCAVHQKLRQEAKVLNFMLAYGGGPQKFSEITGLPNIEARVVVNRYKRIIPKLTKWLEKNGRDASIHGISYSADPYKRRRVLRGEEEWQVINQGKNNPIQAAGANMLKLAMVSIPDEFPIVLVIHDEIVLEVPKTMASKAMKALKTIMEQSADYITGIKGIVKVQPRLANNLTKD